MSLKTTNSGWKIVLLTVIIILLTVAAFLSLSPKIGIPITGEIPCSLLTGTTFVNTKNGGQTDIPLSDDTGYCWSLIGGSTEQLNNEYSAGIHIKTFSLSWKKMYPEKGKVDLSYLERKRGELKQLRQAGFGIIMLLGYHDIPAWVHTEYPDSYYINQYGEAYVDTIDAGDANLVFNPTLRNIAEQYIQYVFSSFGTDFVAVRVGGGRYGELTYPPATYKHKTNCYWTFDYNAKAKSPVPGWHPGNPSPNEEDAKFLNTYLNDLVDFQNWQIQTVRKSYDGPLMVLYPSWGIRPGDHQAALQANLNGSTSAEINGEIQRGYDFARQIAAIKDPGVIITTTWLDADPSGDQGTDARYWSPVKYLAYLASRHPFNLPVFGENTGQGSRSKMKLSVAQMERNGLIGMAWYNETELLSGKYASLQDYQQVIANYNNLVRGYLPMLQSR